MIHLSFPFYQTTNKIFFDFSVLYPLLPLLPMLITLSFLLLAAWLKKTLLMLPP